MRRRCSELNSKKLTKHSVSHRGCRPAWRRQRLAKSGPFSLDVRKRTIVEMPSDIDPFPVASYTDLCATSAIYHRFVFEPRLENIGVVKNRGVAEQLNLVRGNSRRRSRTPFSFISFAKAIR